MTKSVLFENSERNNRMIYRIPRSVLVKAVELIDASLQDVLPWQAIKGDSLSLPFSIAKATLLSRKSGDGHLLEDATRHKCRSYENMTSPTDAIEYVEATTIMFRYVHNILVHNGIILGEDDPLWFWLLDVNREMSTENIGISFLRIFFNIQEEELAAA